MDYTDKEISVRRSAGQNNVNVPCESLSIGTRKDALYDQAVSIVADTQVCFLSMLQRRLSIGFIRASGLVHAMEQHGVVSSLNGANKREVLTPRPVKSLS